MKLFFDLFKKAEKSGSELDRALNAIIEIERRRDNAQETLSAAKQELQTGLAEDIAEGSNNNQEAKTNAVLAAQARLDAHAALLKTARQEALSIVAAGSGERKKRLAEVENKADEIKQNIGRRRTVAISEFVNKFGLSIRWPTEHNGGSITLPTMSLGPEEIKAVAATVRTEQCIDPQAAELDDLLKERQRLNILVGSTYDLGLDTLLGELRRSM